MTDEVSINTKFHPNENFPPATIQPSSEMQFMPSPSYDAAQLQLVVG